MYSWGHFHAHGRLTHLCVVAYWHTQQEGFIYMAYDSVIILRDNSGGNITSLHLNDAQTSALVKIITSQEPFACDDSLQNLIN